MLTGLPNRMLFVTRAQDALNESPGIAVVLLDIDRFKDVNDTLGHGIGDRLLIEVAERLQHAVSEQTTVARLGGDEFALVISDVSEATQAVAIVNDLHTILSRPIDIDGLTLAVTASAGVALAPAHGDDVALLLQRADIAMYIAKERRTTVELYSVEHDQSMQRWLMLGGLLTHAIDTRTGLSVKYQAQADVRTRRIVQVEALARGTTRNTARSRPTSSSPSPNRWVWLTGSATSSSPKRAHTLRSGVKPGWTSASPSTFRVANSPTEVWSTAWPITFVPMTFRPSS